jgi:hypothetical protein
MPSLAGESEAVLMPRLQSTDLHPSDAPLATADGKASPAKPAPTLRCSSCDSGTSVSLPVFCEDRRSPCDASDMTIIDDGAMISGDIDNINLQTQ